MLGSADKGVAKSWRRNGPACTLEMETRSQRTPGAVLKDRMGVFLLTCVHKGFSDQTPCPEFLALGKFLQL